MLELFGSPADGTHQSMAFFQKDDVAPEWNLTVKAIHNKTAKLHNGRIIIVSLLYIRILLAKIIFDAVVPHSNCFMH
jgi:hypothetical protein